MKLLIGLCLVCLPLKHLRLNSPFGYRTHPLSGVRRLHEGVDLYARRDTVYAMVDGLARTGYDHGLGLNVRLQHGSVSAVYGHLSRILVMPQDSVRAGEPIGITGATGHVTGEHLHLSIRYRDRYIDPIKLLYQILIRYGKNQKF
ncbi:M23 family metallopeptidase [Mucilaginibacter sp. PAMB04168]|uniref:M23 family metallopeptidase n=1 Tax=Mucilaginibacter sp. PAMB04168 TaxID=3138567 RepID=UPI0031F63036